MLIAKCYATALHLDGGGTVRPGGAALMHDPTGRHWPKSSCLISSFQRLGSDVAKPTDEQRAWSQNPDSVKLGQVKLPSKKIGEWKFLGRVKSIDYTRKGTYHDMYEHEFKKPGPRLYRQGKVLRLELGHGAVFNWRGFVNP